jgi:hypothetical protein
MLNTGQRFITMKNIKLSDISRVIVKEDGNLIVTIIARVTKCDNNWQQPFSIEGKSKMKA